jgi:hypothetical protein
LQAEIVLSFDSIVSIDSIDNEMAFQAEQLTTAARVCGTLASSQTAGTHHVASENELFAGVMGFRCECGERQQQAAQLRAGDVSNIWTILCQK